MLKEEETTEDTLPHQLHVEPLSVQYVFPKHQDFKPLLVSNKTCPFID